MEYKEVERQLNSYRGIVGKRYKSKLEEGTFELSYLMIVQEHLTDYRLSFHKWRQNIKQHFNTLENSRCKLIFIMDYRVGDNSCFGLYQEDYFLNNFYQ